MTRPPQPTLNGPTRVATDAVRVLAVGGEAGPGPLQSLRQWATDLGVELEWAADLPRATRLLAGGHLDLALGAFSDTADVQVALWGDSVPVGTGSSPRRS